MKSSDKKILIVLAGIIVCVACVFLVFKPAKEDCDSLQSEIDTLQAQYNDLSSKVADEDKFKQETEEYNEQFDAELDKYPADLKQESTVLFMQDAEKNNEFVNNSFSMPQETEFYVLGQGAVDGTEVAADTTGTTSGAGSDDQSYVVETDAYSVSYQGSYQGLKDYMHYIADYRYRMTISQISIAYNADAETPEEECTGSLTLNAYSISGPDRTSDPVNVDVPEGKNNIFAAGSSAGGVSTASAGEAVSYDQDDGESIVSDHSLTILLNSADNDSASGVIAASDEEDDKTYVTYDKNDVTDLGLRIYTEDGKNYLEYSIGSTKKSVEILTNDVTVYVKSAERVNSDDKNGVDVKVTNTTTLPVYFKVVDDDSASPRFNVAEKSGTVKVY